MVRWELDPSGTTSEQARMEMSRPLLLGDNNQASAAKIGWQEDVVGYYYEADGRHVLAQDLEHMYVDSRTRFLAVV